MKKLASLGLILLLVAALFAGCSSNSNDNADTPKDAPSIAPTAESSPAPEADNKEPQEIHVFHFKVELADKFNAMTKEFEAAHPNVTVVNDIVGGGADWKADLKTRFASGKGPDIFVVDGPSMLELWKDRIVDLSDQPWVEHAAPFAKRVGTIDGKLYGMPYNVEGYGLVYNPDLFEKAGIQEAPHTLTGLKEAADKLKRSGVTPFANGYGEWWVLGMQQLNIAFAQQPDPDQFMKDLTEGKATMKGNPMFEDFKNFLDLTLEYGNDNPITTDYKTQEALLATGEAAMIHQGNWAEDPIRQIQNDVALDVMPVPINDNEADMDRLEVGIPLLWVVNKDSEHVDTAKELLSWMVGSDTGKKYLTEEFGFIPAYDNIPPTGLGSISQTVLEYTKADKTIPWSFSQWPDGAYNKFYALLQGYIGKQYDYDSMLQQMDEAWRNLSNP